MASLLNLELEPACHLAPALGQESEGGKCWVSTDPFFYTVYKRETTWPSIRVALPISVDLTDIIPNWHAQRLT